MYRARLAAFVSVFFYSHTNCSMSERLLDIRATCFGTSLPDNAQASNLEKWKLGYLIDRRMPENASAKEKRQYDSFFKSLKHALGHDKIYTSRSTEGITFKSIESDVRKGKLTPEQAISHAKDLITQHACNTRNARGEKRTPRYTLDPQMTEEDFNCMFPTSSAQGRVQTWLSRRISNGDVGRSSDNQEPGLSQDREAEDDEIASSSSLAAGTLSGEGELAEKEGYSSESTLVESHHRR